MLKDELTLFQSNCNEERTSSILVVIFHLRNGDNAGRTTSPDGRGVSRVPTVGKV